MCPGIQPGAEVSAVEADLPTSLFLFCLALPSSNKITHQMFLKVNVWNHACVHVPFWQIPPSRHLSSRKTSRSRIASLIC